MTTSSGLKIDFIMNYKHNCSQLLEKHCEREFYNIPAQLSPKKLFFLNIFSSKPFAYFNPMKYSDQKLITFMNYTIIN